MNYNAPFVKARAVPPTPQACDLDSNASLRDNQVRVDWRVHPRPSGWHTLPEEDQVGTGLERNQENAEVNRD